MPKIHWKNQFKKLPNQSDAHETLRAILVSDPFFSRFSCYQEVPVDELTQTTTPGAYRYDWYIQELGLVIEVHGQQHYKPTSWSKNTGHSTKMMNFHLGQGRDRFKKDAAIDNGLKYLEIPYSKIKGLDGPQLRRMIEELVDDN
jgi:hypothetical protein